MSFPFIGKEQELLDAARTGSLSIINRLLTNKPRKSVVGGAIGHRITSFLKSVNVNCTDKNSYTPLHHAAVNGHGEVVEALLKAEAQPGYKDNQGCTPVHLAAWSGKPDIVLQLLQAGTDEASSSTGITPVHVNQQNSNGDTALHCAAQYGHVAVVDVLLQKNANPTIRNIDEASPLDLAAQYGHREVVHLILLSHPDLAQRPLFNHSPLHLAASNGHRDIAEKLLDNGFSIHTLTDTGTALHEAAIHGKLDVVRLLLDRGVDVDQRDQNGHTVLDLLTVDKAQEMAFDAILTAIKDHVAKQSQDSGTYESLASCTSGGKPMAAVKPLPPEKPQKPEKPVTPDKRTPASREAGIEPSPEAHGLGEEPSYASISKSRDAGEVSSISGPAPPPLPPRSSIFPVEDRQSPSPTLNTDAPKPEKTSPEVSPRHGAPRKPPRSKPPRNTVCQSSSKPEDSSPADSKTPPPLAHDTHPPFSDLYSTIADDPSQASEPSQTESASHNTQQTTTSDATDCAPSNSVTDASANILNQNESHDSDTHLSPTHFPTRDSQPVASPKPALPPRSQSANLDNSVDPQTGKQVSQDIYMEMKGSATKPRPVSEVKPQRHSENVNTSEEPKLDHYGILFPNLKYDQSNKSKRPDLRRANTAPEESVYVGPSPVTAVDKFKDKHGLLKRAHTAPEESDYTPMSAISSKAQEDTDDHENEYAEIPETGKILPKSRKENVYASINDAQNDIESNMLSQISQFSSHHSQTTEEGTPPSIDNTIGETASGKPNNLPFSKQNTNTPLTPTGYVQPPTPDFPPPSPATALMGIELKIQEMDSKRKSRDITTITDESFKGISDLGQSSSLDDSELKVSSSDSSRSNQISHIPVAKSDTLIEETIDEERGAQSPVAENSPRVSKETNVTVIKSEVSKVIPESSIPDISVIKTESRVSVGEASQLIEGCESEDLEMFRKKKSKDATAEKGKGDKGEEKAEKKPPPPKRCEKPKVMAKPSSKVVQKPESEAASQDVETVVEKKDEDVKAVTVDKKAALEANGAIPKGSPVMMRKKSADVDMFADLKRGSTIGLPPTERSDKDAIIKNAPNNRKSLQAALVNVPENMAEQEDIDQDQVMDAINSELAKAPVSQVSTSFDDSQDWAEIQATMASFGCGIARESVFVRDLETTFKQLLAGSTHMQSVGEWLEMVGLAQYENPFITNGFDNLDFLGPNILEEQDLEQIKVLNHEHRRQILQAAQSLPHLKPIDPKCPPCSVGEWLQSLQLPQYLETFTHHGYDTMEKVQSILWDLQLRTVLDISMLGHRKRILASLGERSPDKVSNKRPSLSSLSPDKGRSHLGDLDFYKDYTGVKPVSSSEEDIKETMAVASSEEEEDVFSKTGQSLRDNSIHVRPPHMAQTSSPAKQWRHKPEMLIKGCCNYTAQYLGSTVVPELTGGVESTRAGITKLKKSKDMLAKIPIIMLSISYKGVKFIDAKSKKEICDHDISNIFCACQDTENLNFFAYITRDIETSRHYCHVFSVKSASLAHDIILTLGESFEVAYQIALKDKSRQEAMKLDRMVSQSDAEDSYSVSSKMSTNTV